MDAFLGTIMMTGFNFAPYQWMTCAGQIMPIQQYTALFSIIGTAFGGNGTSTFGLPDLRGRVAIGESQAEPIGTIGGIETASLGVNQLPLHNHGAQFAPTGGAPLSATLNGIAVKGGPNSPIGNFISQGQATSNANGLFAASGTMGTMPAGATSVVGTNGGGGITGGTVTLAATGVPATVPISVVQPFVSTLYCIALYGIFPTRQ